MGDSNNKIWVGWAAFLFVVFHFVMVVIYALPPKFQNEHLNAYAKSYIEPVFSQKWQMFAPCPVVNSRIEVKYYFESDTTDWLRPATSAIDKHSFYRGSYHGELVLAEANLMYWLQLDLEALDLKIGESTFEDIGVEQMKYSYYKIKNYLKGNAQYLYEKEPVKVEVHCFLRDVISGEERMIELPIYLF